MSQDSSDFHGMRVEVAEAVARHRRPLTFVLGAGASLSSNAPSTVEVHRRLESATERRFGQLVQERLHELVDDEVRDQLEPLFCDVVPNVGYRILASLGRCRRIQVINLNWDSALEQACHRAGVKFVPFDPLESDLRDAEAKLPPGRGVLIVHVHGTLERRPRYSLLETLPQPKVWQAVKPLLGDTTLICGASLASDLDVAETIHNAGGATTEGPAVWFFARPDRVDQRPLVDLPQRWYRVFSHDVDFDVLMTALGEELWASESVANAQWDTLVRKLSHLDLPDRLSLVELDAKTRRVMLDSHVVGLVARPLAGKTVGALRMAHLRGLINAPVGELVVSSDPQDIAPTVALAASRPGTIAFIDDPFGASAPVANPRVIDFLEAIADNAVSWAYLSSKDANWNSQASRLQRDYPGLHVATRHPEQWYEHKELLRLAGTTDRPSRARQLVHANRATTPPEVVEGARLGRVRSLDERLVDAGRLLEADPVFGLACVLVRMQELRMAPLNDAEFAAILGTKPETIAGVEAMLYRYTLDGRVHWAFVHPTCRQAVETYLLERHVEIQARLLEAALVPSWLLRCLEAWRLQHGLISPDEVTIGVEAPSPGDWMTERLATAPNDLLLSDIPLEQLDEWELIELAYVLVWVWPDIKELFGARSLLKRLLGRPMGCYAVLEGCLYFQLGADDELWTKVAARLWELGDEDERERLLVLDAVLWREPNNDAVTTWASRAFDDLDSRAAAFGFVRFALGYHPDGLASLDKSRVLEADKHLTWSLDQARTAARLVAWHFAHQSRARAMLHRYGHHDKQWLCQSTFDGAPLADADDAFALARSLVQRPETSGWGFHLLCNMAAVAGLDLRDERAREIADIALREAPRGEAGVISAVLAYEPADKFRKAVQERLDRLDERDLFLDAIALGVDLGDGLDVCPPRFRLIYDSTAVLRTVNADFPNINPALEGVGPESIAEKLWLTARSAMASAGLEQRAEVAARIGRVERGDLRPLQLAARGLPESDPYVEAIEAWRREISSDGSGMLF
jgi:hypothetical protein